MSRSDPEVEVAIGRDDWEKFLSSIERLMSLHQQTLQRLKELGRRNEALRKELRDAMALRSPIPIEQETQPKMVSEKANFLGRIFRPRQTTPRVLVETDSRTTPEKTQRAPAMPDVAMCGKCGYKLANPSRFCQRCGSSFGLLVCSCGRDLKENDKFCDSCGQKVLG